MGWVELYRDWTSDITKLASEERMEEIEMDLLPTMDDIIIETHQMWII
jgi:hypothetical protein